MKTLREYISEAKEKGIAIGHFNISNLEAFNAIYESAKELNVPVIIGVSEGEREFTGITQVASLVKGIREKENFPIFLNADHTYTFEKVKEAIDAGFDSAIFDGAKMSLEENIAETKKCVEYAKACGRDVLIEGELGYIGQSSKILDAIPEGAGTEGVALTSDADAKRYVEETGVDLFAPAVGNIHGMLKNVPDPRLDIERVKSISSITGLPLVLHGASGNSKEDIQAAIKAGVSIVHINTEIRVAFKEGLVHSMTENPDEIAPYKLLKEAEEEVKKTVTEKLKIFNFID
jgi:fructose-bisphosphate aldolase class II